MEHKAARITDNVYWVGAVDRDIRDFHGYLTQRGTTYNAYLIMADKVTLIDTVKAPFIGEMLSRIASVIAPEKIDYVISNHSEMDHSGSLPGVIDAVKPEKVFASPRGVKALDAHFHMDREILAVKDGESLGLGNMNVFFVETPMVHWPDSMWTYLVEEQTLFCNDAFGMHLASNERFADEIDGDIIAWEAKKYYANILTPLSGVITKLFGRVEDLNIPLKVIAPDHGPIWREDLTTIMDWYKGWAERHPLKKVVVAFDTMWQSTALMAAAIGEGLADGGVKAELMPLRTSHRSDIATELLDAAGLIVGSPTMNNNMLPTVADALTYLKGLKFTKLAGAVFGSYGWSGEAVKHITGILTDMKVELVGEGLRAHYVPDGSILAECRSLGSEVAKAADRMCRP
jgi:flavorubredoxin